MQSYARPYLAALPPAMNRTAEGCAWRAELEIAITRARRETCAIDKNGGEDDAAFQDPDQKMAEGSSQAVGIRWEASRRNKAWPSSRDRRMGGRARRAAS